MGLLRARRPAVELPQPPSLADQLAAIEELMRSSDLNEAVANSIREILHVARAYDDVPAQVRSHLLWVRMSTRLNKIKPAVDALQKAMKLAARVHDSELDAEISLASINILLSQGEYVRAEERLRSCISIFVERHRNLQLMEAYFLAGDLAYESRHEVSRAADWYRRSLELATLLRREAFAQLVESRLEHL